MKRKIIVSAAASIVLMLGMSAIVANQYLYAGLSEQVSTDKRSPDCKYPPCD